MAESLTGEQKLRIVLESIIRNVPKAEQCEKYNVSEEEFDSWRERLMKDGGKIYESSPVQDIPMGFDPPPRQGKSSGVLLGLSVLVNLVLVCLAAAFGLGWIKWGEKSSPDELPAKEQDSQASSKDTSSVNVVAKNVKPVNDLDDLLNPSESRPVSSNPPLELPPSSGASTTTSLSPAGGKPRNPKPPIFSGVPGMPRPTFEVNAFGFRTPGRLVVFALDVSRYMTNGVEARGRFRTIKQELVDAISGLSVNSHFNLLLFRNLREIEMLGKTILPASHANKGLAIKWLKDIGEPWENQGETRSRHFDERDIFDKPPKGAVGPWYALYCAIRCYKPDAVFLMTGDCSSMRPQEFSEVEWQGLDVAQGDRSADWDKWRKETETLRLTAVKWLRLQGDEGALLPPSQEAQEVLALRKLQLAMPPQPSGSPDSSWPWREVYGKFRSGLRMESTSLPIVNFIVSLPDGVAWSEELTETVKEFAASADGKLTFLGPTIP